jgi:hypothetical protein
MNEVDEVDELDSSFDDHEDDYPAYEKTFGVVTAIVKVRYKVEFLENIQDATLEKIGKLLTNQDYEDIIDEYLLEILEVIEVE